MSIFHQKSQRDCHCRIRENSEADCAAAPEFLRILLQVFALLFIALTGAANAGFITTHPCGQPRPNAASINFRAGDTVANGVVAKVGSGGRVCLYSSATTDVVVDANGFAPAPSAYRAVTPARLLDTRTDPDLTTVDGAFDGIGRRTADSVTALTVAGRATVPSDAAA